MPENKLKQYGKVPSRSSRRLQLKNNDKDKLQKKSNLKNVVETKKIKYSLDDSSLIMVVNNKTLDDSIWKDSFDKFLGSRSPLRKNNVIKKKVRQSYNLDSSINSSSEKKLKKVEGDLFSSIICKTPIYKRKSFLKNYENVCNKKRQRNLNKQINKAKNSTISSTPLNRNKKKSRHAKSDLNELLFMPTISPIQKNVKNTSKCYESLLKSFTENERNCFIENAFQNEQPNNVKNIETGASERSNRIILDSISNTSKANCKSKDILEITISDTSNQDLLESGNESLMSNESEVVNNDGGNVAVSLLNHNDNKVANIQEEFNNELDAQLNLNSLHENISSNIKNKLIESILDQSLTEIEQNLSILNNCKSPQINLNKVNHGLEVIENTYNSLFENQNNLITSEITEKFSDIEKSIDKLIISATSNGNEKVNLFNQNNTKNNKIIYETNENNRPNLNLSTNLQNKNTSKLQQSIFENNIFMNKLKFLKNCLAISYDNRKNSLPMQVTRNTNKLIRCSSLNAISQQNSNVKNSLRFTLDKENSQPTISEFPNNFSSNSLNFKYCTLNNTTSRNSNEESNKTNSNSDATQEKSSSIGFRSLRKSVVFGGSATEFNSNTSIKQLQRLTENRIYMAKTTDKNIKVDKKTGLITNPLNIISRIKSLPDLQDLKESKDLNSHNKNNTKVKKKIRRTEPDKYSIKKNKKIKIDSLQFPSFDKFVPLRKSLLSRNITDNISATRNSNCNENLLLETVEAIDDTEVTPKNFVEFHSQTPGENSKSVSNKSLSENKNKRKAIVVENILIKPPQSNHFIKENSEITSENLLKKNKVKNSKIKLRKRTKSNNLISKDNSYDYGNTESSKLLTKKRKNLTDINDLNEEGIQFQTNDSETPKTFGIISDESAEQSSKNSRLKSHFSPNVGTNIAKHKKSHSNLFTNVNRRRGSKNKRSILSSDNNALINEIEELRKTMNSSLKLSENSEFDIIGELNSENPHLTTQRKTSVTSTSQNIDNLKNNEKIFIPDSDNKTSEQTYIDPSTNIFNMKENFVEENVSENLKLTPIKSPIILESNISKNENRQEAERNEELTDNSKIIQISPEALNFRKRRVQSVNLRKKLAKTKSRHKSVDNECTTQKTRKSEINSEKGNLLIPAPKTSKKTKHINKSLVYDEENSLKLLDLVSAKETEKTNLLEKISVPKMKKCKVLLKKTNIFENDLNVAGTSPQTLNSVPNKNLPLKKPKIFKKYKVVLNKMNFRKPKISKQNENDLFETTEIKKIGKRFSKPCSKNQSIEDTQCHKVLKSTQGIVQSKKIQAENINTKSKDNYKNNIRKSDDPKSHNETELPVDTRQNITSDCNDASMEKTSTATATDDNSIIEISFDRDELLKNIEKINQKPSLLLQTSGNTFLNPKRSSRTSVNLIINNSLKLNNSLNQTKDELNQSNKLLRKNRLINITQRNSSLSNLRKSSQNKSQPNDIISINRTTVMFDTLHEDPNVTSINEFSKQILNKTNNSSRIESQMEAGLTDDTSRYSQKTLMINPGKWRRSLISWKISSVSGRTNLSQISKLDNINQEKAFSNISLNATNRQKFSNVHDKSSVSNQNTALRDNSILVQTINSANGSFRVNSLKLKYPSSRKTLLLEPTDDEAPIIHKSCSLFNTFEKQSNSSLSFSIEKTSASSCIQENSTLQQNQQQQQNSKNSLQQNLVIEKPFQCTKTSSSTLQYPEIAEETEEEELPLDEDSENNNQSDGDIEYFNDRKTSYNTKTRKYSSSNNNTKQQQKTDESQLRRATSQSYRQRVSYQHQLSVPVCGVSRKSIAILEKPSNQQRCASFIEEFSTLLREQSEVGKNTTSNSFTNDEQLICCPALDVSLRAQLSPRDIVLRRCQQIDPYEFSVIYSETSLRQCRKIGEGVYGEVFMNKNANGEAVVLKIIPIEGQVEINGEVQKNFEQILPEIIIAEELSRLRNDKNSITSGFVEVKNVHCVQGRYPDHLIDLWELYRDNCGTENDHPEIFPEDQLYIVLELANAGQDLEAFNFQNALQSYSAFLQIALSLAVAEEKFEFEHRDLHWGNILLSSTDQKQIYFKVNGREYKIPTHGVKATIIDYTLSRMTFEGCCLYNNLSSYEELFDASGDYQFEVYRMMRKRLDNQWERYDPYTNIQWLHYTIDKMISGARYRCSKTKKHRSAIQTLMKLRDELLDYNSASDYVDSLDY